MRWVGRSIAFQTRTKFEKSSRCGRNDVKTSRWFFTEVRIIQTSGKAWTIMMSISVT
jgi:hypothetical protein